ncbi:MAG: hypothetical protein JKY56_02470 [Kofleriaceae bacterium]|nr:hypothetical protein [Kofleriaceae bacterium]
MTAPSSDEGLSAILVALAAPAAKIIETKQHPLDASSSFTGGMPYFEAEQLWPQCHHCGALMRFIAQLAQQDHQVHFPSQWNLLVFFACGRTDWCLHRGLDGRSNPNPFTQGDWRAKGGTIAVHSYHAASPTKASTPEQSNVVGQRLAFAFTASQSLPDQITVECAKNGYDPLNLDEIFSHDAIRYGRLSRSISSLKCGDSYIGGWPLWGNCVDMTPMVQGQAMRHILKIDSVLGNHSFYEMASLFGDLKSNTFQLVYDGT